MREECRQRGVNEIRITHRLAPGIAYARRAHTARRRAAIKPRRDQLLAVSDGAHCCIASMSQLIQSAQLHAPRRRKPFKHSRRMEQMQRHHCGAPTRGAAWQRPRGSSAPNPYDRLSQQRLGGISDDTAPSRRDFVLSRRLPWRRCPDCSARADELLRLRCSLDTAPSPCVTSIKDYLGKVEAASNGKIKTELFESGQLAPRPRGRQAADPSGRNGRAWQRPIRHRLDADCFQLPALYGQPIELIHKVIDGMAAHLNGQIQQTGGSHDPAPDLILLSGLHFLLISEPCVDLTVAKIWRRTRRRRQAWRARFLGAIPNTTAWPNVPLARRAASTFDGLVSSNESLEDAKL